MHQGNEPFATCPMHLELLKIEDGDELQGLISKTSKIAEQSKELDYRNEYSTPEFIQSVLQLFQHNSEELGTNCLRIIGNLCYDNDKSRDIVSDLDGLPVLISCLDKGVKTIAWRCLLNVSMDNEIVQSSLTDLGLIKLITADLGNPVAIQVLSNLLESDIGIKNFVGIKGMYLIFRYAE